jgi:tetratricopeptide (TPR) repeat protein
LVLLVAAGLVTIPAARLYGQDESQKEIEALRRQVKELQKQVEDLKRDNDALRRNADVQAAQALRQRKRAEAEVAAALREAEAQRRRAEANFRLARKAVEEALRRLSPEDGKPPDPDKEKIRKQVLEVLLARALASYQKLLQDKDATPEQKAQALGRVGDVQRQLGRHAEAEAAYRSALELQRKLVADFPAVPGHRHELARGYLRLGELNRETGRIKEAEHSLRQAIAVLEKLVKEFPTGRDYRKDLAQGYGQLGRVMQITGRPREARELEERAAQLKK